MGDADSTELAKWLELRSKRCTYLELRETPAESSMVTSWALADVESFATLLEAILEAAESATRGAPRMFFLFSFKKEGDAKHESRFTVHTKGAGAPSVDDGGKGVIAELRIMVKDLLQANLEAGKVVVDQCRALGDATTKSLVEVTKQLGEHQRYAGRQFEMMQALAEDRRGERREELEGKTSLERTRVMGEVVAMLVPAAVAKFAPGVIAKNPTSGDLAVMTLFRTVTESQRKKIIETGALALSPEQMVSAVGLVAEIEHGMQNGGISSPLLRQLAAWLGTLDDKQSATLRGAGEVQLTQTQAAEFLELYLAAYAHAEERSGNAKSAEAVS